MTMKVGEDERGTEQSPSPSTVNEAGERSRLLAGDPICTSRDQLDGVVDRPEQSLDMASAAPTFLVTKDHSLETGSTCAIRKNRL